MNRETSEKRISLVRTFPCTLDTIAVTRSIFIGLSLARQTRGIQGPWEIQYSRCTIL